MTVQDFKNNHERDKKYYKPFSDGVNPSISQAEFCGLPSARECRGAPLARCQG